MRTDSYIGRSRALISHALSANRRRCAIEKCGYNVIIAYFPAPPPNIPLLAGWMLAGHPDKGLADGYRFSLPSDKTPAETGKLSSRIVMDCSTVLVRYSYAG